MPGFQTDSPYSKIPKIMNAIQNGYNALRETGILVVSGSTGTGKSHLAEYLHLKANPNKRNFICQSSAALTADQFTSQLFGHRKGAFSDALRDFPGLVGLAEHGTLCLEELPQLGKPVQAGMLRFLQERKFRPLGGTDEYSFQGKIIFSSNIPLAQMMKEGLLREDFAFRIMGNEIFLPSLHQRIEDFDDLAFNFFMELQNELSLSVEWDPFIFSHLKGVVLMGNLHELKSIILHYLIHGKVPAPFSELNDDGPCKLPDQGSLKDDLRALERKLIERALENNSRNLSEVARKLGISRRSLFYKLKEHGLNMS